MRGLLGHTWMTRTKHMGKSYNVSNRNFLFVMHVTAKMETGRGHRLFHSLNCSVTSKVESNLLQGSVTGPSSGSDYAIYQRRVGERKPVPWEWV